ncbi:ribokinase [Salinibacillus aidingensis]|uniref:Ribokinase n=1 Tax=Salinibacillus aidingensis TaxID=237684 RepID=A0ABN1AXI9_9BACI
MNSPKVTVVGSINMDFTVQTERMPNQGETVLGSGFATYPGGKGANQAVAAARLGAKTTMIGAVGQDIFGDQLIKNLDDNGILTDNVKPVTDAETGTAHIILSERDNRIIVNSGANFSITKEMIQAYKDVLKDSDVILLQLEIPMEAVIEAAKIGKDAGVKVVLNPAPFQPIPNELLNLVDYMTPNEYESVELMMQIEDPDSFKQKLIITKGKDGVEIYKNSHSDPLLIPAYRVEPVDTTGAGDSFNGAFAFQIGQGVPVEKACRFANAVASLSITKQGAQAGLPSMTDVESFLKEQEEMDYEKARNFE